MAALAACLSIGVRAQNLNNVPVECGDCHCAVFRPADGSWYFPAPVTLSPSSVVCLGTALTADTTANFRCGTGIWRDNICNDSRCGPAVLHVDINSCPPGVPPNGTNWWEVVGPGDYRKSGDWTDGFNANFTPTNCGIGTVTFHKMWTNINPCTGLPGGYGGGQVTINSNFTVVRIEITPHSTNALINKCLEPNRSVVFCLTNSCFPGGVTWSLDPANVPNGASISPDSGCATVTIGDVATNYAIKAISNDNPDCQDSATLTVTRDCDCSNHVITTNAPAQFAPSEPCSNSIPSQVIYTNTCTSLVYSCDGEVHFTLSQYGSVDEVAHCPWPHTQGDFYYWKCRCGSVIKKTRFRLYATDDPEVTWATGRGKTNTWQCPGGMTTNCFTIVPPDESGTITPRDCDWCDDHNEPDNCDN
jgi:hypothetical protein